MQTFFNNLTDAIKTHDIFYLMAHKNIDLDAFGSCLCMYQIIKSFDKKCYIILNEEVNESMKKTLKKLVEENKTIDYIYSKDAKNIIDDNSMVIILDTHKEEIMESSEILEKIKDKIVIDHHIKSKNNYKDTIISYINSGMSSTVEIMVHYLKYLNKEIDYLTATIMLAGIEIDTNNFNIKTVPSTYETAADLARFGADHLVKRELLQENKDVFLKRQDLIKNAYMFNKNTALCILDNKIYEKEDLAMIATELLQFEDVEVAYCIGKLSANTVGVSAKSLGNIDVESIMKKMQGGGHTNNAATQLCDMTLSQVKRLLIETIK